MELITVGSWAPYPRGGVACSGYIAASQGVDLLLAETTFRSYEKELAADAGHMTTADAAFWAMQAGIKKLLAVHFWPNYDQQEIRNDLAGIYPGQFNLARAGLRIQI